jgi:hypothetical protein
LQPAAALAQENGRDASGSQVGIGWLSRKKKTIRSARWQLGVINMKTKSTSKTDEKNGEKPYSLYSLPTNKGSKVSPHFFRPF